MKKSLALTVTLLAFSYLTTTIYATTRYVKPALAGTGDGLSWTNASNDLQLTINNSSSGDEIWVAAGTYKPNRKADDGTISANNRNDAFVLKSGVKIYGGFAGSETLVSEQNWTTNATILSGDIGTIGTATDNCYHVVISAGAVGTAELNGFTITGGYAVDWGSSTVNSISIGTCNGGGITCSSSSPTLKNLNINNCFGWFGGGIFISGSSPIITEVTVESNTGVKTGGGGIFNTASSSPTLANIIIRNNNSVEDWTKGGGIYNDSNNGLTITNALIYKNSCHEIGGGIYNSGGASALTNVTIVYNTVRKDGSSGGGISGTMTLQNCLIWGNKANTTTNNVSGSPTYTNTLVEGASGTGIISSSNPLFVNANADNYHLTRLSPAINKGLNSSNSTTTDLDGNSRVFDSTNGGIIDLGAYEYQSNDATISPFINGVMYVKKGGTGDGTSWANAIGELADALSFANGSSFVTQIWVAAGTYYPRSVAGNGSLDRDKAFVLLNNIKIYGGFAGTESTIDSRNLETNISILSGDLGTANTPTDNAYHVVISSGTVGTAELNGFTITKGYADKDISITVNSNPIASSKGGGIYCISSSPILKNLNINNCYGWNGGGIYNTSSSPILTGVIIDSNTGTNGGGGIYNTSSSSPSITNAIIRNNITVGGWTNGGGIYNDSSNPTIVNTLIYKNISKGSGAGIHNVSGTPLLINVTIVYNTIIETSSNGNGAGINGTMTLQNCLIWGNTVDGTTKNISGSSTYSNTLAEGVSATGIISNSNPLFFNASTDNYRLTRFSPAINKGSNATNTTLTDLDGNSRIYSGGTIDLGAYEYQSNDANFSPDASGILYVKKGSSGGGNSWSNAIGELSDALFIAGGLSSITQIWVAAETYYPTYIAGNGSTNRDKAFVLINNIKIYGGFAGTETSLSQRNINANATILSGDIGTINVTTDNCYHVVISAGTVGTACLDGFTITKGNANGSSSINVNAYTISQGNGGGIHLATSAPAFANLVVTSNNATLGGGASIANSTTAFSNSKIDSNTSTTNGGGIYCYISKLTLNSVEITNNTTATNGGGLCTEGWTSFLFFTNVLVKNNIATSGSGGGMYLFQIDNSSTYKGMLVCNNQAGQYGGGVCTSNCSPAFVNLTLTENKAGTSGGGLYKGGDFTMNNCIVWGNINSNTSAIDNCYMGTNWYFNNTLLQGATLNGTNIISNSDPQFINPAIGDYHLPLSSPAKDKGINAYISEVATDLDGLSRVYNTTVDLGAYECHLSYPVVITGASGITDGSGYYTLKAAFDAINAQNQSGKNIVITINNSTTEAATASLNNGNWSSIKIYPTVSGLSVSGDLNSNLINFSGADNVTIDGRVNATGSTRDLTINNINTGSSASTITFYNDAESNTISYCNVKGASLGINGIIYFSDGSTTNGNNLNTISNNLITNSGGNRSVFCIVSGGKDTKPNTGNIISNNEFKDFLNSGLESSAIYTRGYSTTTWGATTWTITGNSFYETQTFSPTGNYYYRVIRIGESDSKRGGVSYTISNNYIGGSAPQCGGTAWTKTSSANNPFVPITLFQGATGAASIQNNTIQNISWSNSGGADNYSAPSFAGIDIISGDANIGTITGNKIGSDTGTGSIFISASNIANGNGGEISGIRTSTTGVTDIQNNKIGSITTTNTFSDYAAHFYGIYRASSGATTISNNAIGSNATPNSINATGISQIHDQHVIGIYLNNSSGTVTINNNLIANLTNGCSSTTTGNAAYVTGIKSINNTVSITNNTIHDLSIAAANNSKFSIPSASGITAISSTQNTVIGNTIYNIKNTFAGYDGAVNGIYFGLGSTSNVVSNNTIYNLSVTGTTAAPEITGISCNSGVGTNTVSSNFIYSLSAPAATNATLCGLNIFEGTITASNNIISLGENTPATINGIKETGTAGKTNKLYFNSVYIGGKPTTGALNSYALYSVAVAQLK